MSLIIYFNISNYIGGHKVLTQNGIARAVIMLKFILRHGFLAHSILYIMYNFHVI